MSTPRRLNASWILVLLFLGVIAYAVFAAFTGFHEFTLDARNETRWMFWRYILFGFWLLLAITIFLLRNQKIYAHTLWASLAISVLFVALLGTGYLRSHEAPYLYLMGTAVAYVFLAGMLSLTIENKITAIISIIIFIAVQIPIDMVVLAIAAHVNMRM